MIYGVDVASWQAENFALVVDGHPVSFAIIKATEGTEYVNPKFSAQRDFARRNGLLVGYYHFIRSGDIDKQADHFLSVAQPAPEESLWLDWENPSVTSQQKDQWIQRVREKAPQNRVGLYCNLDYRLNRDTSSYCGDALWIARHEVTPGQPGIDPGEWLIHQYSDVGIDHNVARFATKAEMAEWASGLVEDPVGADARILALLVEVRAAQAVEALKAEARHDALKEGIDQIRLIASELSDDSAGSASAIADELARRLQS